MSDFSELCPLFTTGVYHELTLPEACISSISTSGNIHHGFCFSRKVVVTAAYLVKTITSTWTASTIFNLKHALTKSITVASQTLVASWHLHTSGVTTGSMRCGVFYTGNIATTTFSATDIVTTSGETDAANMGRVALIIRYRDA